MRRRRNWDTELSDLVRELDGQPFAWGDTDCGMVVLRALRAMYPPDRMPLPDDLPEPDYRTEEEARAFDESIGGVEGVLREGGAEEVPLAFARQGDVICGTGMIRGIRGAAVVVAREFIVSNQHQGIQRRRLRRLREIDPDVTVLRPPEG